MKWTIAMGALALLLAPAAMAATLVDTKDATNQIPEPLGSVAAGAGEYYIADDGSMWMESNGIPGLQQHDGHNADGSAYHADTLVSAAPSLDSLPGFALPGIPSLPPL